MPQVPAGPISLNWSSLAQHISLIHHLLQGVPCTSQMHCRPDALLTEALSSLARAQEAASRSPTCSWSCRIRCACCSHCLAPTRTLNASALQAQALLMLCALGGQQPRLATDPLSCSRVASGRPRRNRATPFKDPIVDELDYINVAKATGMVPKVHSHGC